MIRQNKLSTHTVEDLAYGILLNPFTTFTPYDDRVIANTIVGKVEIDTAFVDDTGYIETAIANSPYSTEWIPVCESSSKEEALDIHNEWVELFKSGNLPESIIEIHSGDRYYK